MTGSVHFSAVPTVSATEIRLMDSVRRVPTSDWATYNLRGADLCERLVLEGKAHREPEAFHVDHGAVARLSPAEAAQLELPPVTTLRAVVEGEGLMTRSGFNVSVRWTRSGGQNVIGASRVGAWLSEAGQWRRLSPTLFAIAEAADAHQAAAKIGEPDRLASLAALQHALPEAAAAGTAEGSGLLGKAVILEADAFSLDAVEVGDDLILLPVLHRAGAHGSPKLLPEDWQNKFATEHFGRFPTARGVYTLPGGTYVVLSPMLRRALQVVKDVASRPIADRRAFLFAPRAALRAAIGDEVDEMLTERLLVETTEWSDRVIGLGLWQPRVLPWVTLAGNDWFEGGGPIAGGTSSTAPRKLNIGGADLALDEAQAVALEHAVRAALAAGQESVPFEAGGGQIDIPATPDVLDAIRVARGEYHREKPADTVLPPHPDAEALLIRPNESARDIEAVSTRRAAPRFEKPATLRTTLKQHQTEGLAWLQQAWAEGSPGVLLADDMGLGKTLQGLAFFAWLRSAMETRLLERAPLLIVAPTGLLANWQAEHKEHLAIPGLGQPLLAYGAGLKELRLDLGRLDVQQLTRANWVLTTYETLRDHQLDFGEVAFGAILLDEAQKVKTPGIRLTDAIKAMKSGFTVAMTGTPVENRLADLWCIMDVVSPGRLGDLKRFSAEFEAQPDPARLVALRESLDRPIGGRAPAMLRRMKEDRLPDLPSREDRVVTAPMQGRQREAYDAAVALGRNERAKGRVLEALQRLRAVSLHPDPEGDADDSSFIAASARLRVTMDTLDAIAAADERALVFVDDLALMARLSSLLQRRYHLAEPPMTINGKVAGLARQARVDRFQAAAPGFDVMLLSPRAGGVGLTLTRANHVIHLSRWWNPAIEDQCTGRAHRIGQTRSVVVHVPLAVLGDSAGRSFDENLNALLERKRLLTREALMPTSAAEGELAGMLEETLAQAS